MHGIRQDIDQVLAFTDIEWVLGLKLRNENLDKKNFFKKTNSRSIVEDHAFAPARLPDQGEAKPIEE